jgi:signal transduction histidine kinase
MVNSIRNISLYGSSASLPDWLNRNVRVANYIALITGTVAALLAITYPVFFNYDPGIWILFGLATLLLLVPFVSRIGKINLSRFLLVFYTLAGTLTVTISRKYWTAGDSGLETFFQPRAAILIFSIIPFIIFSFREKRALVFNAALGLFALMLFDPMHNLLGVGYYQLGYTDVHYYNTNFIFFFFYLFLIGIVFFFKSTLEEYEAKNEKYLSAQMEHNRQIEDQKEELETQGYLLKQLLDKKDRDLTQVAEELLQFNHQLLYYSYALSHNLRGPLASLMGLVNLLRKSDTEEERKLLLELADQTTENLDNIIHDLNHIVEERTDTFHFLENINIEDVCSEIETLLKPSLRAHNVRIVKDCSRLTILYSSRKRIHYILFCLLSNAIQYRKPEITPEIKLRTRREGNFYLIEVEDNGQGIDLTKFGAELFKPFKRFHVNSSGKGIGLYIAKLQVDKLHGKIEVKSTPGTGTVFRIMLKDLSGKGNPESNQSPNS